MKEFKEEQMKKDQLYEIYQKLQQNESDEKVYANF